MVCEVNYERWRSQKKKCVSRKSITYVDFFQLFASRCYNLTPIAGPLRLEWGDLTESERVINDDKNDTDFFI